MASTVTLLEDETLGSDEDCASVINVSDQRPDHLSPHPMTCRQSHEDLMHMKKVLRANPYTINMKFWPSEFEWEAKTPLQSACLAGHEDCVEYLLKSSYLYPLMSATYIDSLIINSMHSGKEEKSLNIMKLFIKKGLQLDANVSLPYSVPNFQGQTTYLNIAIDLDFIKVIKLLLRYGAKTEDVNATNTTLLRFNVRCPYVSPLHHAFNSKKPQICKVLFLHGAILNLHIVIRNNNLKHISLVSLLHMFVESASEAGRYNMAKIKEMLQLYWVMGGDMHIQYHGVTALAFLQSRHEQNQNWQGFDMLLQQCTCNPLSLQQLSRLAIRNAMGRNCWRNINKLQIPSNMLTFMKFKSI